METFLNRNLLYIILLNLSLSSCGVGNNPNIKDGFYKVEHCQMIEFGEQYEIITDDCEMLFGRHYDGNLDDEN